MSDTSKQNVARYQRKKHLGISCCQHRLMFLTLVGVYVAFIFHGVVLFLFFLFLSKLWAANSGAGRIPTLTVVLRTQTRLSEQIWLSFSRGHQLIMKYLSFEYQVVILDPRFNSAQASSSSQHHLQITTFTPRSTKSLPTTSFYYQGPKWQSLINMKPSSKFFFPIPLILPKGQRFEDSLMLNLFSTMRLTNKKIDRQPWISLHVISLTPPTQFSLQPRRLQSAS